MLDWEPSLYHHHFIPASQPHVSDAKQEETQVALYVISFLMDTLQNTWTSLFTSEGSSHRQSESFLHSFCGEQQTGMVC